MDIPNHLSHKAIVKLEDYSKLDGKYPESTDAQGLSIGLAQWSNSKDMDLSAKVWRYTGENGLDNLKNCLSTCFRLS
jgi:hypothetical protein